MNSMAILGGSNIEDTYPPYHWVPKARIQKQLWHSPWKPCSPATIGCSATQYEEVEDHKHGSYLMGLAVKNLERLEIIADYRQALYGYKLAQKRLQVLMEMEISKSRQADDWLGIDQAYTHAAKGEHTMVCPTYSRRYSKSWALTSVTIPWQNIWPRTKDGDNSKQQRW